MSARTTGEYVAGSLIGGTGYRAFVPAPLPPDPPLSFEAELLAALEAANQALGRLDGIALMLPDRDLFLYQYVRKEAVLSSQIEGTQSTLSDLLLFELDEVPGVPFDDVTEVSNYVAALDHGLVRMREGFPLSLRLIRDMHGILMRSGRGMHESPGEFRRTQNWIGGRTPAVAAFVPPPPDRLNDCLGALEKFLHVPAGEVSPLVKAALVHVQFETIHPFNDGNGRIGRLLIALMLCHDGVLREPSLYLSLYFKLNRARYYELLDAVRRRGDWEGWLRFFVVGVHETAQGAVNSVQRILACFERDRRGLAAHGRRSGNLLQVYEQFVRRPLRSVPALQRDLKLAAPTIRSAIARLTELGVLAEVTGQQRNRVWVYRDYYEILNEGAQPI